MTVRALICDDDARVREVVRALLGERQVEFEEAADGLEGMALFSKQHFDLVITDFLMPRMDGMQLVRNIRLSADGAALPIILMSAISKSHILDRNSKIAPDHYVNKPFKAKKMAKLLDRVLAKIQTQR